ncbi:MULTISPECIES: DUF4105 domain-containing protein [Cycloclasticus]|jgi:hypothetical protein|uniref:DUF4105 domain-containing protein n=1 Tax=Cycloclasticus pugetii TaxID=34068 RepID=A0AB33Z3I1_9GAMM|nr:MULTISPECIES: DUF4105 domain-containing protein [Cycloclasticus]ATI03455.1 DUF4105 domain-containing protein [Cycloclasticus sp. PY97N]EPD13934.1 hypothetical protein L196_00505 [Cycloclasticus pugetii]
MLSKLALFFIVFFPAASFSNTGKSDVEQIINHANELRLSQHPTWIKLMHYEQSYSGSVNFVSAIHDDAFFNAEDGAFNPHAELEATITAFQKPLVDELVDNHAQCKFPARLLWLQRSLGEVAAGIQTIFCPKYDEWTLSNSIKTISVVYASGFLENPASYYGHILLKLNSNRSNGAARLFDPSVNYGAIIPPNEDPVTYILKGIFGGYDGGFSQTDYYFHNRNYGELELRDIWEYEINFEQREVNFIVAHAWEVLGKPYTYYFFRKNCAYRLAELIEIIDGVSIMPSNQFFTLPRALLQNMYHSQIHEEPLVRSVDFRPSRQSRFYKKFDSLISSERNEVRKIIETRGAVDSEAYGALTNDSKIRVIDTILDYYQFAKSAEIVTKEDADNLHRKALVKRFQLPLSKDSGNELSLNPPHTGRKSSYAQVGVTYNESLGNGYSIRIRPAYYDVLDAASGHVQDSALTMGEIELFTQSGGLHISHFDFLKIESVNTASTNLPGDKGKAWKVKLGIQQQDLSCFDCLTTRLEGDYGYAVNLNSHVLVSAYLGGGIQGNRKGSGHAFIRASAFSHVKFTDGLNMRLGVELPKQIDGSGGQKKKYVLELRQRLGINSDIRFKYEEDESRQFAVNLGYYF